jgi:glutamate-5-semialdehyde dehydrogenase
VYDLVTLGRNVKKASRILYTTGTTQRDAALFAVARALREHKTEILQANRTDVEIARRDGCRSTLVDQLSLTGSRIEAMAADVDAITALPDPIGVTESGCARPNGLSVVCTRVPVGVVGIVAEGAPIAMMEAAALCLKSGNACVLAGGEQAYGTNRALFAVVRQAIADVGMPADIVSPVEDTSTETTSRLLGLTDAIDVLIPCGDASFVRRILRESKIPVLDTGCGSCHLYVDAAADCTMAVRIADNAATSAPEAVNAVKTVLVHEAIAEKFLPELKRALALHGVTLYGCGETRRILPGIAAAGEEEWLGVHQNALAVRVVTSLEEAAAHIEQYSLGVAAAIVTNDLAASRRFCAMVDASTVCVNASTRFVDGVEFGFGVGLGVAAQKLHVRGPISLQALTTTKYIVTGDGHTR